MPVAGEPPTHDLAVTGASDPGHDTPSARRVLRKTWCSETWGDGSTCMYTVRSGNRILDALMTGR